MNKREFGSKLESFAEQTLKKQGLSIIERNFLCKLGEIDLIAKDGETLTFVEVRYRKQASFGGALASVDRVKQKKLINTAQFYLQQKKLVNRVSCRFDVFAIEGPLDKLQFDWIKNAFGE
nr:YraN family protein [Aliikangiella sp. G2MR2-5]